MITIEAAIAATRFGLGPRAGEMAAIISPEKWLLAQLSNDRQEEPSLKGLPRTQTIVSEYLSTFGGEKRSRRREPTPEQRQALQKKLAAIYLREASARFHAGLETKNPFRERLVHFWSDHFTVSITKPILSGFVGAFEREAIRPHVTGRFEDLLMAACKHPAMILYLDNHTSIGPNSPAGRRGDRGLNENLAREILELHTLGVNGGYSQKDVTNFAKVLTGWTFTGLDSRFAGKVGEFQFVWQLHEPGSHKILGKSYRENGINQPAKVLRDLASHPSTARHIALKMARYFIADDPGERVVGRLEEAFLESWGNLKHVTETLVRSPEAWAPEQKKFKQPFEYILSTLRAAPAVEVEDDKILGVLSLMGQRTFSAPSPAGWPDETLFWASPDGIMRRVEWSNALSHRLRKLPSYEELIAEALGPLASEKLKKVASRAENRRQALALVFASPEFMRR